MPGDSKNFSECPNELLRRLFSEKSFGFSAEGLKEREESDSEFYVEDVETIFAEEHFGPARVARTVRQVLTSSATSLTIMKPLLISLKLNSDSIVPDFM